MLFDFLALALAFMCLLAIISPHVPTGIVITVGLCLLAAGALWACDDGADPRAVMRLLIVGALTIGIGVAWRMHRHRIRHGRPHSDWGDLDTRAGPTDDGPATQGAGQ